MTVALFESRFGSELAGLLHKQGAATLVAPAIVEAPLTLGPELEAFVRSLERGEIDVVLVLTGVGHRKLVALVEPLATRERLAELLRGTLLCVRGPKAAGALKESGLKADVSAPAPHTWSTLLEALDARLDVRDKVVAIQQYGVPHERLTSALGERGAQVLQVPVYRWQLPHDLAPLERNVEALCRGDVDVLLFTSGPQAGVMLEVARQMGREEALRTALKRVAVGSIGPSCTESMKNLELEPDFEPEHGKMGHLVREAAGRARALLAQKRA